MHVPENQNDTAIHAYVRANAVSHTYLHYRFPEKQLHNLRRIHEDTYTHLRLPDKFKFRCF